MSPRSALLASIYFAGVFFVLGFAVDTPAVASERNSCSIDPATLKAARLTAATAYVTRVNYDIDTFIAVCDRYYTEDAQFILRGIGMFAPQLVAKEYGYVLFNFSTPLIEELWQGKLFTQLDTPTITWLNNNTMQFWQTGDVKLGPIFDSPGHFRLASGGVRNYETLIFEECSDRISSDIVVSDRAIMPIYTANNIIDVQTLCDRIMARCVGDLKAYDSVESCIAFMKVITANNQAHPEAACPYTLTSNSTTCRNFHATNALVDPKVHCPHTAINSPMCVDTCLPACANCPANSHCVATYADATALDAVYTCTCNDGYVAGTTDVNGATSCVPKTCTADWQCGTPYGSCSSTTGRCACPNTFDWDPIHGGCQCPDGYVLTWDIPANNPFGVTAPACKPPGGCLARQHCTDQTWNRVQCAATQPPSTVSVWLACQCNPGFTGGWISPCECPYGDSRVFWSSKVQGEVCLAPGECTDDWHCTGSTTHCLTTSGDILGSCA